MSEADVIREHIVSDAESIDEQWGCVHIWADMTPGCAGYTGAVQALASLDSLTTRLAEVTNRMHVLQAQLDDSATRLAEVERENDLVRHENYDLREQLTQAREALERLATWTNGDLNAQGSPSACVMEEFAADALATINREGETG